MTLRSDLRSPTDLSNLEIDEMFELMSRHYQNTSRTAFVADLREKQWVIELRDNTTGTLCGFSTQKLINTQLDGVKRSALFSGDTIVDREYWGSPLLALAWGKLAIRIIEQHQDHELYWFLICKGFRTYRFLSVFFEEFTPCWNRETSVQNQRILDAFALDKFGSRYDSTKGVLSAAEQDYRIKPEVDLLSPGRRDPHVAYFLERNPGYLLGDELCCLAPLNLSNFSRAAKRLMDTDAFKRLES